MTDRQYQEYNELVNTKIDTVHTIRDMITHFSERQQQLEDNEFNDFDGDEEDTIIELCELYQEYNRLMMRIDVSRSFNEFNVSNPQAAMPGGKRRRKHKLTKRRKNRKRKTRRY